MGIEVLWFNKLGDKNIRRLIILLVVCLIFCCTPIIKPLGKTTSVNPYYGIIVNPSKGCNQKQAEQTLARMIFGEGEGLPLEERRQLGRFLVSEAVKNQRTLCEEYNYKYPKGSYRYSSSIIVDKRINKNEASKKIFGTNVVIARNELLQFNRNPRIIDDIKHYDSFVTVELAYYRPQKWFLNHIEDYVIAGAHVFMRLNHKEKTNGYEKLRPKLYAHLTASVIRH